MDATEIQTEEEKQERYLRWADSAGWMLVGGLAVEFVYVLFSGKPWFEVFITLFSDGLIIGGVAGELKFARWAKTSGDRLYGDAKAKLADAIVQAGTAIKGAAEATERASIADQNAAEARLELARFRQKRVMTSEQSQAASERLKEYALTEFDFAAQSEDPEILFCVLHINAMLVTAGWSGVDWEHPVDVPLTVKKVWPSVPSVAVGWQVLGIVIGIGLDVENNSLRWSPLLEPAARALAAELKVIPGMEDTGVGVPLNTATASIVDTMNKNVIHICVGRKP